MNNVLNFLLWRSSCLCRYAWPLASRAIALASLTLPAPAAIALDPFPSQPLPLLQTNPGWNPLPTAHQRAILMAQDPSPVPRTVDAPAALRVVYPPNGHKTTSDRIFLIGSAPPTGEVTINGQAVQRSPGGNFAPSFPLQLGRNEFTLVWGEQTLRLSVERRAAGPPVPEGFNFAEGSLEPAVDMARRVGEPVCFRAIAPAGSRVTALIYPDFPISLLPQPAAPPQPANADVLVGDFSAGSAGSAPLGPTRYAACVPFQQPGKLGMPLFSLERPGSETVQRLGPAAIEILSGDSPTVVAIAAENGVARTGPSTDHSRLTPLPRSTRATVTGREGDWLRLDYGGWIRAAETETLAGAELPQTLVRGIRARSADDGRAVEVVIPLQVPVPLVVSQTLPTAPSGQSALNLTLYGATAATDTVFVQRNRTLDRLQWQQSEPGKLDYQFWLSGAQPWGYSTRYEGQNLIVRLRQPPVIDRAAGPLGGLTILLDPGHGGPESGAVGPGGVAEKTVNLTTSLALQRELQALGATVVLTRSDDREVSLGDRVAEIARREPTLALSVHYNALPDNGNAETTQGLGIFWYHPQAEPLAQFLHDRLVDRLDRASYGVFWGNLALTRPTAAPSLLLELGFMSHPEEYEWITNAGEQEKVARAIAQSLVEWFKQAVPAP